MCKRQKVDTAEEWPRFGSTDRQPAADQLSGFPGHAQLPVSR